MSAQTSGDASPFRVSPGSSARQEYVVSLLQQAAIWLRRFTLKYPQARTMESLKPVNQHRAILLVADVLAHVNDVVGGDSDQVRVKCRVMEIAKRQAVRD